MRLFIYCVRDRAVASFGNPMFMVSDGQAIRSFTDEINREHGDNQLFKHPDDFDLYKLGEFDTESGEFTVNVPEQISIGKMVKIRS